jgi:hypothetical protein
VCQRLCKEFGGALVELMVVGFNRHRRSHDYAS